MDTGVQVVVISQPTTDTTKLIVNINAIIIFNKLCLSCSIKPIASIWINCVLCVLQLTI